MFDLCCYLIVEVGGVGVCVCLDVKGVGDVVFEVVDLCVFCVCSCGEESLEVVVVVLVLYFEVGFVV